MFSSDKGVISVPFHAARFWSKLEWMPSVGLVGLVLHPTIASLFGPHVGRACALVILVLFLPACRRVIVGPFIAILVASLFIAAFHKSVTTIFVVIPAYAIFHMIMYQRSRFYSVVLTISVVAGVLALMQFFIPGKILNIHATAYSHNHFLDQYRPTSLFPTQAYYNQFILLLIPLFMLVREKRAWVLILSGFFAAFTGSTAGLLFVLLSLFLGVRRVGGFVLAGFLAAIAFMAAFYRERLVYNFSIADQITSIKSRVEGAQLDLTTGQPDLDVAIKSIVVATTGHPSLVIAVQCIAIAGVLLASTMAWALIPKGLRALPLLLWASAPLLALMGGQLIHSTIGSLYFALSLGVLLVLVWMFLRAYAGESEGDSFECHQSRLWATGRSISSI